MFYAKLEVSEGDSRDKVIPTLTAHGEGETFGEAVRNAKREANSMAAKAAKGGGR